MDAAYDPGAWHDFGVAFVSASALSSLATFRATHAPRGVSRDRLARFFIGELSAGLLFAGGLGLLVHALGGAYLVAAGIVLGVLIAMLAAWILFIGLAIEQREREH
jgi:hypothetical protein